MRKKEKSIFKDGKKKQQDKLINRIKISYTLYDVFYFFAMRVLLLMILKCNDFELV